MADYIEPTQTEYNTVEQTTLDVVSQATPNLITKTGSVIRELIVRPAAYLTSWAVTNIRDLLVKTSVAYLKTSQATENPIADLVASNYFVTRREGTGAKGIITLTLSQPVLRLSRGTQFTVGGVAMVTPEQYLITNGSTAGTTSNFKYIKSTAYNGNWIANIPVVSTVTGKLEISVGADVVINLSSSVIIGAELTSPITGGTDTETDAEMMARAEYNTAEAGIGSYYGLRKKFDKAPVAVLGLSVTAGEDMPLLRARYNNVNINPGGIVDAYVKTVKQPTTDSFQVTCTKASGAAVYKGTLPVDCVLHVDRVIVNQEALESFEVLFGSTDEGNIPPAAARLSVNQTTEIAFELAGSAAVTATVFCTYIPGIRQLQNYIDDDAEHFIGQDTKVKAAVPVEVGFRCCYAAPSMLTDDQLSLLKNTIEDYINSIPVGTKAINFSDVRKVCASALPTVDLRLPCVMTGKVYTKSGDTDTFHTNTGIFDISDPTNVDYWDFQECYFSACVDRIVVEAV